MTQKWSNLLQPRSIVGIAIVIVGAFLLFENLGYDVDFDIFEWWPLVLILIGIVQVTRTDPNRRVTSGVIFIGIGLLIILDNFDILGVQVWDFWPVIIIIAGLKLIGHVQKRPKDIADGDYLNHTFILGGGTIVSSSKNLQGGNLTVFMGGGELDLRNADMTGSDMQIDVFAFWGGIDLIVPDTWIVEIQGTPILGGIDNKTRSKPDSQKRLVITGTAIMGGVDVKN